MSRRDVNTVKITMELKQEDKVNKKPTYKCIKEYILGEYGMKVHTADIERIKREYGIDTKRAYNRQTDEIINSPLFRRKGRDNKKSVLSFRDD